MSTNNSSSGSKHKLEHNGASSSKTTTKEDDNGDRGALALPDLIHLDLNFMEDASTKIKKYMENVDTKIKMAREKLKELQTRDQTSEMELQEQKMDVKKLKSQIPSHPKIHSGNSVPHQNPWPEVNKTSDEMMHNLFKEQKFEPAIDSEGSDVLDEYQRYLMCFSWFPPLAIIKKRTMIYLWIALYDTQNIGEDGMNKIFDDLVEKGFIMPVKQNSSSSPNSCMMRPSLRSSFSRELCEKNFCHLDNSSNQFCAVGFHDADSYQCLVNVSAAIIDCWPEQIQKIRDLKILYLGRWHTSPTHHIELPDTNIFNQLKNVKQLTSLTFLSLRGISLITELPSVISKCTSLKILDLRACHNLEKISDWIGKLKALTHLDMSECYLLEYLPKTLANLSNLEVLKGFVVPDVMYDKEGCTLGDLSKLKKLQKLNLIMNAEVLHRNWVTPMQFRCLRKLTISCGGSGLEICWDFTQYFPSLQKLDLQGFSGTRLPSWVGPDKLPALETLYIRGGQLWDLKRHDIYEWGAKPWQGVKILRLKYLSELRMKWGKLMFRFPNLTKLQIVECPMLGDFPCDEMNKRAIDTHEDLELEWLHNVSHISAGQLGIYLLSNLEILASVTSCAALEYLFQLKLKMLQREDVHDVTINKIKFPKLEYLKVENLENLGSVCRGIDEIDFPQLKQLVLINLPQINCFFHNDSNMSSNSKQNDDGGFLSLFPQTVTFPSLEELDLELLPNVSHIWSNELPIMTSFAKLKKLNVWDCGSLSNMFHPSMAQVLVNLQILFISGCSRMEAVVGLEEEVEEGQGSKIVKTLFPQLRVLHLYRLPNLKRFCHFIHSLELPLLTRMVIRGCPHMEAFSVGHVSAPKLYLADVSWTGDLNNDLQLLKEVKFPSLEKLELRLLPNVSHIWSNELPIMSSFAKLKTLNVYGCESLSNMFHPSMAGVLVNLQKLIIENCSKMEAVVGLEEEVEEGQGSKIVKTLFPQLTYLELGKLPNLRRFCHFTHSLELPLLTRIEIRACPHMEAFSVGHVSAPKLYLADVSLTGDLNNDLQLLKEESKKKEADEKKRLAKREAMAMVEMVMARESA